MGYTVHMATTRETKQADERGRISLGKSFANCTFLVQEKSGNIVISPARVIPEREAWLYENEDALKLVREGLEEARKGEHVKPPDLEKARRFAATIPDE